MRLRYTHDGADKRARSLTLRIGPGAGYCRWNKDRTKVVRHGRTAYIVWRSRSYGVGRGPAGWWRRHLPLEVGITRNGNRVPYLGW